MLIIIDVHYNTSNKINNNTKSIIKLNSNLKV